MLARLIPLRSKGSRMNPRLILPILLVALNGLGALLGLQFPGIYREPPFAIGPAMSKATLFSNDLFTLLIALPAITAAGILAHLRASVRAQLLWLGGVFYTVYNQSFYLFSTDLNRLYPIYLASFVIGLIYLVRELLELDLDGIGQKLAIGGFAGKASAIHAIAFAAILLAVWTSEWLRQVHRPVFDPIGSHFVQSVAALDITLLVPGLVFAAIALWRKDARGPVAGIVLNTAIALYMAVMACSKVANARGIPQALDELPLWTFLSLASFLSLALLLRARSATSAS